MHFKILDQGFVVQQSPVARATDLAISPRVVLLPGKNGEVDVLCSFMHTAKTATNDFVPLLCRSTDWGRSWSAPHRVWPHLRAKWSLFVGISRDSYSGRLFLYGTRTPIGVVGESLWSEATQGLKANELIWAASEDNGSSWTEPSVIPMPIAGSAEAPGPICVLRSGRLVACYSPYNTFDPALPVDRNQVVALYSDDAGKSWRHTSMVRFENRQSVAAEAWVVELSDGRLLGTCWHVPDHGDDLPNKFALSHDGGTTWTPTASTGTLGQTTALAPWTDGRTLFLYNQRKHGEPGVRLAVVRPTEHSFGIEHDELVWRAETRTQSASAGNLNEWSDFSFGEPSIVRLPDETWLVTLWCIQPSGAGIRYVRLRIA
jgi:hypothetical protein